MPTLESLPPEIFLTLLRHLPPRSLLPLILSSPHLHTIYLTYRRPLLQSHLLATFGRLLPDMHAVYQLQMLKPAPSSRSFPSHAPRLVAIQGILDEWQERKEKRWRGGRLEVSESLYMLAFYRQFVAPLQSRFVGWLAGRMPRVIKGVMSGHQLTEMENIRVTRALYRFHLLSLLSAPDPRNPANLRAPTFFLDLLEPWEKAEVLSVYMFISVTYRDILSSIRMTPLPIHPQTPSFPRPSADCATRDAVIFRGLVLFRTILLDIPNSTRLSVLLSTNLRTQNPPAVTAIAESLFLPHPSVPRPAIVTHRATLSTLRFPLPFIGDIETGPPYAWTVLWRETYSDVSPWHVPYVLKIWGWVFWDGETMERTGLMKVMKEEWRGRWGEVDPRDAEEVEGAVEWGT